MTIFIFHKTEFFATFNLLKIKKNTIMENHQLTHEFPQFKDKINHLKLNDDGFKKLYVNYEEVNALIKHYEEGEQNHTTDDHLTDLRKKRVHLKDELYQFLKE